MKSNTHNTKTQNNNNNNNNNKSRTCPHSDPFLDKKVPDLSIVPISISYEKTIEAEVYTNELLGESKTKEVLFFFFSLLILF
jgi:hypothetical protein